MSRLLCFTPQEASVAEKFIQHPNIVCLLDCFSEGKRDQLKCCLVYRFAGVDLGQMLEGRSLNAPAIRQVLGGALCGLSAMHGAGVIHTDIKPANLLVLEEDGVLHCRVGDLGSVVEAQHPMPNLSVKYFPILGVKF